MPVANTVESLLRRHVEVSAGGCWQLTACKERGYGYTSWHAVAA